MPVSKSSQSIPLRTRKRLEDEDPFLHVLTHKDLHLHPVRATLSRKGLTGRDGGWFRPAEWEVLGLPAPVRKLLAA